MKVSWRDFESYTNQLLKKIRQDGYTPQVVVGVGISGLVPAALVMKGLQVQHIEIIVISSYNENNKRLPPKVMVNNLSAFLKNKKVLVVDDIVASGKTFSLVKKKVMKFKPKEVKFAAVVVSEFICKKYPDYWGKSIMRSAHDFISLPWDS